MRVYSVDSASQNQPIRNQFKMPCEVFFSEHYRVISCMKCNCRNNSTFRTAAVRHNHAYTKNLFHLLNINCYFLLQCGACFALFNEKANFSYGFSSCVLGEGGGGSGLVDFRVLQLHGYVCLSAN